MNVYSSMIVPKSGEPYIAYAGPSPVKARIAILVSDFEYGVIKGYANEEQYFCDKLIPRQHSNRTYLYKNWKALGEPLSFEMWLRDQYDKYCTLCGMYLEKPYGFYEFLTESPKLFEVA